MGLVLGCMAIGTEIGLEMHSQFAWYLELHILVAESYSDVAPRFAGYVAVLRLVI